MTLTLSNRRALIGLAILTLGAVMAISVGWPRFAIVLACVAALALIQWSLQLLSIVTEQSPPKPDAADPRAGEFPCPECDYSLRGLPPAGVCPECGEPFDLSQTASPSQHAPLDRE